MNAVKNKVTIEEVDRVMDSAEVEEHVFFGKDFVASYKLPNGFTVIGRAACVDPANFDIEIGRKVARSRASETVWMLLGYDLQNSLAADGPPPPELVF